MSGFELAPPSERTLSLGEYLVGAGELTLVIAAFGFAAWRLRRRLLAGWSGAPARLAEAVLAIAALIVVSEALGTFGAFTELGILLAAGVVALAGAAAGPTGSRGERAMPAPELSGGAKLVVALACAAVAAGWMVPTLGSLAAGMDRTDSLWYHGPLAARFVQTGSLGEIFHFDPIFFAAYYPANSEALHAVPILAFGRDIVSPVLNLGFLALGLLAAWCIGRPYGVAPAALVGGAVALGAQNLVEFQAGEALNDIVGVAFVMAAVAILANGFAEARSSVSPSARPSPRRGRMRPLRLRRLAESDTDARAAPWRRATPAMATLGVAGLAAGLALGTKLSFVAPVAALTVGVVAIAPRGTRLASAAAWSLPALVAGGYWYARNLFAIGNPVPLLSFGPLGLPAPERDFELRPGFSVAHYFDQPQVWWDWFVPGLEESFGVLWPVTLVAMLAAGVLALARGREPLLRALGAMVLVTAFAYLFTPLTAGGEEGEPIAFIWNVRYLAPAAAVGLAVLPCIPALRASARTRAITLAALVVLLATTVASLVQWQQGHAKGAIGAGVAVLTAFAVAGWLRARGPLHAGGSRAWRAALAAAAVAIAVAAGFWEQRHYLQHRYEDTGARLALADALRFSRDLRDARVAVAGVRGVFNQYPFYGTDLSNHVQWLGVEGSEGAWLRIPSCERWRTELNRGGYTHVVTTYDPFFPGQLTDTKEALWTRRDPAATQVLRNGPVSVFELEGELDPARCAGLPRLSAAELDGDSVNRAPLANQPPGTGPKVG